MSTKIIGEDILRYHRNDAISASKLEVFHQSSLDFYERFVLKIRNPVTTDAMDYGQAFHALQQGPEAFDACVVQMKFKDFRTDEAKAWKKEMHKAGKLIVTADELAALEKMAVRVRLNKLVSTLIEGCERELTWRRGLGKFSVQCRTDVFNSNGCTLPNGKTVPPFFADWKVCASLDQFRKSWVQLGYPRKAIFYQECLATCLDLPPDAPRHPFFWIACCSEPPFEIKVFELGEKSFPVAKGEVISDLKSMRNCFESGVWESPEQIETIDYPWWAVQLAEKKLMAAQQPTLGQ